MSERKMVAFLVEQAPTQPHPHAISMIRFLSSVPSLTAHTYPLR